MRSPVVAVTAALLVCTGCTGDAAPAAPPRDGLSRVAAYVVPWDAGQGVRSLQDRGEVVSTVNPVWYTPADDGSVVASSSVPTAPVVEAARRRGAALAPSISNARDGIWDGALVGRLVNDPDLRRRHVEALVEQVVLHRWDGLDIDYENLRVEDRDAYVGFLRELEQELDDVGAHLSVTLQATTGPVQDGPAAALDYAAIGRTVDEVRVMAYDHAWSGSAPGPVAPIGWVRDVVDHVTEHVPRDKVLLGVGLYGYDWADGGGTYRTWAELTALAASEGAEIRRDPASASPWFRYDAADGSRHTVWFEDARSLRRKLELARSAELGGVFLWQLGGEDPAGWPQVRDALR